jgi:hypothetical protein
MKSRLSVAKAFAVAISGSAKVATPSTWVATFSTVALVSLTSCTGLVNVWHDSRINNIKQVNQIIR